jgi:hypothetical protein
VFASAFDPWIARTEEPTWVNTEQLLAKPSEFDGKRVSVTGYYVGNIKSGSRLFVSARAANDPKGNRGYVWIDETTFINPGTPSNPPPPLPGISELCQLTKHHVRIIGVFHYRPNVTRLSSDRNGMVRYNFAFSRNGLSASEITNVVYFRVARKSAEDSINPCGMYHKK